MDKLSAKLLFFVLYEQVLYLPVGSKGKSVSRVIITCVLCYCCVFYAVVVVFIMLRTLKE